MFCLKFSFHQHQPGQAAPARGYGAPLPSGPPRFGAPPPGQGQYGAPPHGQGQYGAPPQGQGQYGAPPPSAPGYAPTAPPPQNPAYGGAPAPGYGGYNPPAQAAPPPGISPELWQWFQVIHMSQVHNAIPHYSVLTYNLAHCFPNDVRRETRDRRSLCRRLFLCFKVQ